MNILQKALRKEALNLWVPALLAILFAALAWYRLVVLNSDYLYEAQDQSFWQPGTAYYEQLLQEPGGALIWLGQYLTQYFYEPAVGASILIGLWLLMFGLLVFGAKLPWFASWVALFPPMLLLWSVTSLGYWIYTLKVSDWYFTPTLFWLLVAGSIGALRWMNTWVRATLQVLVIVSAVMVGNAWAIDLQVPDSLLTPFYPSLDDENFHAEMRMERAAEEGRWSDVLTDMKQTGKKQSPTRSMWMLKNMALLNQGRLIDNWLDYPCLTQVPVVRDSCRVTMVETSGPLLYYLNGSLMFAYRWSMENMVEYGPSMKRLRLMTRCALLKGETALARKYIDMLSRTRFHRDWAEKQRAYLTDRDALLQDPDYQVAYQLSRFMPNMLDSDNAHAEQYLTQFYSTLLQDADPLLSELCLFYALQTQQIASFWNQFEHYIDLHKDYLTKIPRCVQEAAYLYIQLEPQTAPRTDFPFDREIIESHQRFLAVSQQLGSQGLNEQQMGARMKREFGNSFYWYYFFCRGQQTY